MAINRWTTAQILNFRYCEPIIGLIKETLAKFPEIANFYAIPIEQTTYKTLVQTQLPTVAFREDNVGRETQRPTCEVREVVCKFLDASWDVDQKVVDEFAWGPQFFLQEQTVSHIEAAFAKIAAQTWYGTVADATGFIGIMSYLNSLSVPTVVSAGAGAANACTSVFAVSTGLQRVGYAWGRNARMDDGPVEQVRINDPAAPQKTFYGWGQKIHGHVGLQVGTPKCIGRICNITTSLTDEMFAKQIAAFETGFVPEAFYMTRKAQMLLRNSRQPYHPQGTPVPFPDSVFGIPIYVTDSLRNNEAIVT